MLYQVREVINDLTMRLAEHGIAPKRTRSPPLHTSKDTDPVQEQLLLKVYISICIHDVLLCSYGLGCRDTLTEKIFTTK